MIPESWWVALRPVVGARVTLLTADGHHSGVLARFRVRPDGAAQLWLADGRTFWLPPIRSLREASA